MNKEAIEEVVKKLVGPILPVGETREDDKRLENLKKLIYLTDVFISEICEVGDLSNRQESSIKVAGRCAEYALEQMKYEIECTLKD